MPIVRTYGCNDCGHTWRFIHMTREEPPRRCERCAGRPHRELSAPALSRNAAYNSAIPVPQSRAKREDLAVRTALEGTGHGDINTQQREGDIAAKTVTMPDMPRSAPPELQRGFRSLDSDPKVRGQQIAGMGAQMSAADKRRNMSVIAKMRG